MSLRDLNIEARRQRILEAARRLIAAGGVEALTMRKLAAEADLSVTTLYNLYGVRAEILHALVDDAVDRIVGVIDAEAPLDDPLERCRAVITVSVRELSKRAGIHVPMVIANYGGLPDAQPDRRLAKRAAAMQQRGIEQAIAQGLLQDTRNPEQLGLQIYHGFELACIQWGYGLLTPAEFEARALYGLYLALASVATDATRASIDAELHRLERQLARTGAGDRARPKARRRSA
ncbi:MAG: helix-turn-helix domain-containing protein [Myxococcota bacterium]